MSVALQYKYLNLYDMVISRGDKLTFWPLVPIDPNEAGKDKRLRKYLTEKLKGAIYVYDTF